MSSSISQIRAETRSRTLRWFVLAVIFALVWVIVWLMSDTPKAMQTSKSADITSQDLPLPTSIDSFEQFAKEVPKVDISSTVVRDMRNYPSEFKDKKFFDKHKNRWTVQVMNVAQNDIITGYLKGRQDRDKFAYFRYSNGGEQRFILTYGIMGSRQEALGAIKTVDFGLPKSVTPVTEQMSHYLDMIDNYERTEEIVDSSPNAPRKIKLQATRNEIPAVAPKEKPKKETEKKENAPKQTNQKATTSTQKPTDKADDKSVKPKASNTETPKETKKVPTQPPKERERKQEPAQESPKKAVKEKEDAPKVAEPKPSAEKEVAKPMTNTPSTPGSSEH